MQVVLKRTTSLDYDKWRLLCSAIELDVKTIRSKAIKTQYGWIPRSQLQEMRGQIFISTWFADKEGIE